MVRLEKKKRKVKNIVNVSPHSLSPHAPHVATCGTAVWTDRIFLHLLSHFTAPLGGNCPKAGAKLEKAH